MGSETKPTAPTNNTMAWKFNDDGRDYDLGAFKI